MISKILKKNIKVSVDKKRIRPKKSEVDRLLSKNKKAKKLLNWKPKYSGKKGFYKALEITINWFKDPKNLKLYKKEIPRPFLILFAPKTLNRCLENIDKYPVDTYVKYKVDMGYKKIKDKKEEVINVADMELYNEHPKNIEKKY